MITDTETTGLPSKKGNPAGLVEFAAIVIHPTGEYGEVSTLINPEMTIPRAATDVHGITESMVADAPTFEAISDFVRKSFGEAVVSGYNTKRFDVPVLLANMSRYGREIPPPVHQMDVRYAWTVLRKTQKGTLTEVAAHYSVSVANAHRALDDVVTTALVLERMIFSHGLETFRNIFPEVFGLEPSPKNSPFKKREMNSRTINFNSRGTNQNTPTENPSPLARIKSSILEHVAQNGQIDSPTLEKLVVDSRMGVSIIDASFLLGDMLSNGEISCRACRNDKAQQVIQTFIHQAIERAGGVTRLKPIKYALDELSGRNTDYIQLRVALMEKGLIKTPEKSNNSSEMVRG